MAATFKPLSNTSSRTFDLDGKGITSTEIADDNGLDVNVIGGDITIDNVEINVELDAQDGDNVAIHNSSTGDEWLINPDGSGDVNVIASVLPDGASTEATLADIKLDTARIPLSPSQEHVLANDPSSVRLSDGTVFYKATTPADTQPVSAVSLPLPSGAATLTEQQSQTAILTNIDAGIPAALGQTTMAASMPVVIASNQTAVPISAASLPLPTGAATAVLQTQPGVDIRDVTINNAAGAAAVNIQDGGNSITVDGAVTASGTVTANQGTPAATANRWPMQMTDGTDLALVTGAGEQNVLATAQPGVDIGDVTINNAAGVSAVNIQDGGNSITIDATSLPLPTGAATLAEQQTQTASLSVMDDWDESDRAKVNTIVGQAGVQGASGTVSANTQRVVLATDVALPAGTNAIGKLSANSGVDIGDVTVDNTVSNPVPVQGNLIAGAAVVAATTPYHVIAGTTGDSGTVAPLRVDSARNVHVSLYDTLGVSLGTVSSNPIFTDSRKVLSNSSPTAATVGVTSAQAVAQNINRKGLVLTNTSINVISFGLAGTAILNSGITLQPGGVWVMDSFTYTTVAVNAIASAASSNLAIQEFT